MRPRLVSMAALAAGALALAVASEQAAAQGSGAGAMEARAELRDAQGKGVGRVTLVQHPRGVLIRGDLSGLPPGWHAIHVHQVGKCEPPFESAGGHVNPTKAQHGLGPKGPHAGDLPNIHASGDGTARFEMLTDRISLGGQPGGVASGQAGSTSGAAGQAPAVLDADGAAIVVHAKADDYRTDPAGASGERIACGVIQRP